VERLKKLMRLYPACLQLHILEHKQAGKLLPKISSKMEKYNPLAFKINLENM